VVRLTKPRKVPTSGFILPLSSPPRYELGRTMRSVMNVSYLFIPPVLVGLTYVGTALLPYACLDSTWLADEVGALQWRRR